VSIANNTRFFTASDWRGLVDRGVAVALKSGKTTTWRIDDASMRNVLTDTMLATEVSTAEEFELQARTAPYLVHTVLGLPEGYRLPPQIRVDGVEKDDPDWLSPVDGLTRIVGTRLSTSVTAGVQAAILAKGFILITGTVHREVTDLTDGVTSPQAMKAWAVTQAIELVSKYQVEPDVAKRIAQQRTSVLNATRRVEAVPAVAPVVIAAQEVEAKAIGLAHDYTYSKAVEGLGAAKRSALDTSIADRVSQYSAGNVEKLKAIASGGVASTADDSTD
jgi:hypothetical protein